MSTIYGREGDSLLYRWHRRTQTRLGNAAVLWMARHCQRLPERRARRLGMALGTAMRLLSPRHARIVMTNLRLAFSREKSEREIAALARACYQHLGLCLTEFMRLPAMSAGELLSAVQLRGRERLDEALSLGRGAILLTGHLGNWEFVGSRIAAEGYPLSVIARAQRDTEITEYARLTRERMGMRVLHRDVAVRGALRALRDNELVGILIDQNAGDDGVFVDFFGQPASTAPGAAAFALRTGAAVLPTWGWREPDGTHVAQVDPAVPLLRTGDRQQDIVANTAAFTSILEDRIRRHPEQWFWLHKRWKSRPPAQREASSG
ncbi:MAG: lysophospholipid acyltransferase family protein [Armatimonadota bacterium]